MKKNKDHFEIYKFLVTRYQITFTSYVLLTLATQSQEFSPTTVKNGTLAFINFSLPPIFVPVFPYFERDETDGCASVFSFCADFFFCRRKTLVCTYLCSVLNGLKKNQGFFPKTYLLLQKARYPDVWRYPDVRGYRPLYFMKVRWKHKR